MSHALHDLIRHNSWATGELLQFCRTLDDATLNATVPGTYGTVIATLRHLIDSEMSLLFRLLGKESAYPWQRGEEVGLDVLAERAATLATTWEEFIAGDVDTGRPMQARGGDGVMYMVPAGIFITQAIHHGNEHRAH
jgi:uncharacterized damage-inducible protein DinB